jgi:hypothetical protein
VSFSENVRNFEKAEIATTVGAEFLLLTLGVDDPNIYLLAGVFA